MSQHDEEVAHAHDGVVVHVVVVVVVVDKYLEADVVESCAISFCESLNRSIRVCSDVEMETEVALQLHKVGEVFLRCCCYSSLKVELPHPIFCVR